MEPELEATAPDRPAGGAAGPAGASPRLLALLLRFGLLALGLAAAAALASFLWQRPLRGLTVAERAFAQFTRLAGLVGLRPATVETPFEYGARVTGAIPEAAGEIHTITDAFVRERFARRPADDQAGSMADAWARLRSNLLRGGLRRRLKRLRWRA
jgi:hypothetical protein